MKNPLRKRLPREVKGEFGKYIVIFLFMAITIGFISGALVAGNSMLKSYNGSFEKYNIEYGNFEIGDKADTTLIKNIKKQKVWLYENFYLENKVYKEGKTTSSSSLRIFKNRKDVNKVCVMKGKLPVSVNEIAIDRMYADNNKIKVEDKLKVGKKEMKVTGFVALPDYSALFSDNTDSMFDAVKFGVAIVSDKSFESMSEEKVHYSYSWKYNNEPANDVKEKVKSDKFLSALSQMVILKKYIPRYTNQAINFTGSDLGSDRAMYTVLLYILIVIIAFVFAVTTNNTITKEANVIGTLRASGYTKGEIVRHYMTMPLLVTLASAIVGNVLGYTCFKNIVAEMYFGSYSLTKYETLWNQNAFLLTTVIPLAIIFVIILISISRKMSISPLNFLRRDLAKRHKKKAMKLPKFTFIRRFRLRIIFQNIPGYITLFVGICFANVLLLFGMMMNPLLEHYQDEILNNQFSKYQYILSSPVDTSSDAEKYSVLSLKTTFEGYKSEEISIYGIDKESHYMKQHIGKGEIYISDGFAEKYSLKKGHKIILKEDYGNKKYSFKITNVYKYPASLCVFMNLTDFNSKFDNEKNYFNGYFSNDKITDIDSNNIVSTITKSDLTKTTRQLKVSMGSIFYMINVFAVALYLLLVFLLAKLVLEKNTTSISMVKILGYGNKEVHKLYLSATKIAVVISLIVSLPASYYIIKMIYRPMMTNAFTGWLTLYVPPIVYLEIFVIGLVTYLLIEKILYRKIKKVPMGLALKNVE